MFFPGKKKCLLRSALEISTSCREEKNAGLSRGSIQALHSQQKTWLLQWEVLGAWYPTDLSWVWLRSQVYMALYPATGHGPDQEGNMSLGKVSRFSWGNYQREKIGEGYLCSWSWGNNSFIPRRISIVQCSVNKYFPKITGGIRVLGFIQEILM